MAIFNFNIVEESATFSVNEHSIVSTDCATQFVYSVVAPDGDKIAFDLSATGFTPVSWILQSYSLDGTEYTDWTGITTKTVTMANELLLRFSLENSGVPGQFDAALLTVDNTTQVVVEERSVERTNDSASCSEVGGTFDQLTDTPSNKTGDSLRLVRVNVGETALEYVDPGTLGNDLNYTHTQISSASWVIPHSLGKMPSVTVLDGSGNRVHGDVVYTDLNNLTITFNIAFAGVAYLN